MPAPFCTKASLKPDSPLLVISLSRSSREKQHGVPLLEEGIEIASRDRNCSKRLEDVTKPPKIAAQIQRDGALA